MTMRVASLLVDCGRRRLPDAIASGPHDGPAVGNISVIAAVREFNRT